MIVMALDHTREFLAKSTSNPLDPARTNVALYLTRWGTHICAPVFVFLAGTAIYLQQQRNSPSQMTKRLLTRGLWLVVLELTIVNLIFNFSWRWNVQLLEVIWVIGVSMMMMAALIHLNVRWSLLFGILMIGGHNALDRVRVSSFGQEGWLWQLLHVPGMIASSMSPSLIVVAYPLVPWVGVMALGYSFGPLALRNKEHVQGLMLRTGTYMLAVFILLRWSNVYGDPQPWTRQAPEWRTVFSFLNVQKYPPSLLFLLVTLGLAALVLAALIRFESKGTFRPILSCIEMYGRVPLFYFLLHLTCIHATALVVSAATGTNWRWWVTGFPAGGVLRGRPPGFGFGLYVVWSVWIAVVVGCYPACKWYAGIKSRSRNALLSYL